MGRRANAKESVRCEVKKELVDEKDGQSRKDERERDRAEREGRSRDRAANRVRVDKRRQTAQCCHSSLSISCALFEQSLAFFSARLLSQICLSRSLFSSLSHSSLSLPPR